MASQLRAVSPEFRPWTMPARPAERSRGRPRAQALVAVSWRARAAWGPLHDIAYATPGTVIVGLDGTTLRIREDGGAEEIGAVPRRWSVSADPTVRASEG